MKGIYLASFKAYHPKYNIVYQDINGKRDIAGDMMEVDLTPYDFIIATPPCNYYSRANYRRETSSYSQATKHLLPDILKKLCMQEKPFIVENVRNPKLFKKAGIYELPCFIYEIGRHTYWSNVFLNYTDVEQEINFHSKGKFMTEKTNNRQGGENVRKVIEVFWKLYRKGGDKMLGKDKVRVEISIQKEAYELIDMFAKQLKITKSVFIQDVCVKFINEVVENAIKERKHKNETKNQKA